MKQFNKEEYSRNIAVHCPTQKEWDQVTEIAKINWSAYSVWDTYKNNSYIRPSNEAFGNVTRSGQDYEIIKAEDFIKEYTLDENNWCVKLTEGNKSLLQDYWKNKGGDVGEKRWSTDGNSCYGVENGNLKAYYQPFTTVITDEDFKKYILKQTQTTNMEKKIIGYKAPMDLFDGEIEVGTVLKEKSLKGNYSFKGKLLPKEIVETWEACYEEEFKVDDYIVTIGNLEHLARKIVECRVEGNRFYWKEAKETFEHSFPLDKIRKATAEEIKKSQTVKFSIGNPSKEVKIGVNSIRAVNQNFNITNVTYIYKMFDAHNIAGLVVAPKTIWIGCSEGTAVTKEEVQKVIDEYSKINQ